MPRWGTLSALLAVGDPGGRYFRCGPGDTGNVRKRLRPDAARDTGDRLKLHRREMRLDGRDFVVVSPRPGTEVRFSTNYFHDTWHILSDLHGARFLGRLLWGLAYQRRPGTVVVIDQSFIDPSPFDAEPAYPIVLVPVHLAHLTSDALKQLKHRIPMRDKPTGTVRWQTPGLAGGEAPNRRRHEGVAQFYLSHGMLVFGATSNVLRSWAVDAHRMGDSYYYGMDYTYLEDTAWADQGEVQIFTDYHRRVSAAKVARAELRTELGAEPDQEMVWDRGGAVRARRGCL